MDEQDRFIGIGQVARIFGVSTTAVRKWEVSGRIPTSQRMEATGQRIWRASEVEKVAKSQVGETSQVVSVAA